MIWASGLFEVLVIIICYTGGAVWLLIATQTSSVSSFSFCQDIEISTVFWFVYLIVIYFFIISVAPEDEDEDYQMLNVEFRIGAQVFVCNLKGKK